MNYRRWISFHHLHFMKKFWKRFEYSFFLQIFSLSCEMPSGCSRSHNYIQYHRTQKPTKNEQTNLSSLLGVSEWFENIISYRRLVRILLFWQLHMCTMCMVSGTLHIPHCITFTFNVLKPKIEIAHFTNNCSLFHHSHTVMMIIMQNNYQQWNGSEFSQRNSYNSVPRVF